MLAWLVARYTHSSEATWHARLAAGEVEVDGQPTRHDTSLQRGQTLAWHRPPWVEPDVPRHFQLVHEDGDLLVVDKPSGLPTMPSGGYMRHTLLACVRERWPEATPMHRLGTGTSGLVVLALTADARAALQAEWRALRVDKTYRTIVTGEPAWSQARLDTPIGPVAHPLLGTVHAASAHGRRAVSHATVRGPHPDGTVVDVVIDTGRPHQIRIHLAAAGHPLAGDPLYLPGGHPRAEARPTELGYRLHAMELTLTHPRTGVRTTWRSAPPWT